MRDAGPRALIFVTFALAVTWPLAAHLGTHLPLGELPDATVPWLNLWTLRWNADRFAHGFAGLASYWDAPIFFPAKHALALSEPLALPGVVYALLACPFGAVAAYGLLLVLVLVANGFCAHRLLRVLGASPLACTWTGVLAIGLPFVQKELGVLQLTLIAPLLWALAELALLFRTADARAVVRLALALVATLWSCAYYALLAAPILLAALPSLLLTRDDSARWTLRRELFAPALRLPLLAAALVLLCGAAPLLSAQQHAIAREHRSADEVRHGSATWMAYLRAPSRTLAARVVPALGASGSARRLYPGALLCGLALLGFLSQRGRSAHAANARFLAFCVLGLGLALFGSFGTRLHLGTFRPYAVLVQPYFPGYALLRSPYRFAAFVQLFLLVLAGLGLDALAQRRRWLVPLTAALVLCETVPLGTPLRRFPSEALYEPWVRWLATHPGGALATVPPALGGKVHDYEPTTLAMLQSLEHGHPLIDGYSGFFPVAADRLVERAKHFPSAESRQALRHAGVRYVIVDDAWLEAHCVTRDRDDAWQEKHRVFHDRSRSVYEL